MHEEEDLITNYEQSLSVACSPTDERYLQKGFIPSWEIKTIVERIARRYKMTEQDVARILKEEDAYIENKELPIVPRC